MNTNNDDKVQFVKDISDMALVEIFVCIALLILSRLILKMTVCSIIASIGLIGSTVAYVVSIYLHKKWTNQLW